MPHCIEGGTIKAIIYETFNGVEWEKEMEETNKAELFKYN